MDGRRYDSRNLTGGIIIKIRVDKVANNDYVYVFSKSERFWIKDGVLVNCNTNPNTITVKIPKGVTVIGEEAFFLSSVVRVLIPETITEIQNRAFNMCKSLRTVKLPKAMERIGRGAFSQCSSLKRIRFPQGLTTIDDRAFFFCSSLKSVKIPSGVTRIGDSAFAWCFKLQEVILPDSVTEIGEDAFERCEALTSITIPESVIKIKRNAFGNCHPDFKILGKKGSEAECYAKKTGVVFEEVD